jgi:hypothetical protein
MGKSWSCGAGDHILAYINPLLLPNTHRPLSLSLIPTTFQYLIYRRRIIAHPIHPISFLRTLESPSPPTIKMSLCHDTDTAAPSPTDTIDDNARLTGGSYVPEKDSVFFITPPDHVRFPAYVPAGIEISYNKKPSFVQVPDCSSPWEAYCPNHDDLVSFRQEAISNNILTRPFTFRVHYGPNDYDTYDQLPAGTRIQKALQLCPSCVSSAAGVPMTRPSSSTRLEDQSESEAGRASGRDSFKPSHQPTSIRIKSKVYPFSQFIVGKGENYLDPTHGDITGLEATTGEGYFFIEDLENPEIVVYNKWKTASDTLAGKERADILFMPDNRYHRVLVSPEDPVVVGEENSRFTLWRADQTHISIPIPNRALASLLPAWKRKIKERCETKDRQSQQASLSE